MLNLIEYHEQEMLLPIPYLNDKKGKFRMVLKDLPNPYIPFFNFMSEVIELERQGAVVSDIFKKYSIKIEAKKQVKIIGNTSETEEKWVEIFPGIMEANSLKDQIKQNAICSIVYQKLITDFVKENEEAMKELSEQAENFI